MRERASGCVSMLGTQARVLAFHAARTAGSPWASATGKSKAVPSEQQMQGAVDLIQLKLV